MTNEVYILDALRTPRAKSRAPREDRPGGTLSQVPPHELVRQLIEAHCHRTSPLAEHISSLTLGCVGQINSQGGHIAHACKLAAKLEPSVTVQSINNYCVSGLTAVGNAANAIAAGRTGVHLAGGVESLSQVGFLADNASLYSDPALNWTPPIMGAELLATLDGISKQDLDDLTLRSHQRANAAWSDGKYQPSVIPISDENGTLLNRDEAINPDLTMGILKEWQPAFTEQGAQGYDVIMLKRFPELNQISHVHSVLNCPAMVDAAALVSLADRSTLEALGQTPKARIKVWTEAADDSTLQLTGGMRAVDKLLEQTGLAIADFDRIEFMEAFAATAVKFIRDYQPDMDKLNVNGGHLAMGHPLGATGAILLTTLVHELERCDGQLGLVVAQAGGGIGSALIVERV